MAKDDKREKILYAALKTFCRMGYEGTSIEDIAKTAACSHGLVYYYFKNKEEVFFILVEALARHHADFENLCSLEEGMQARDRLMEITYELRNAIFKMEQTFYYFQFLTIIKLLDCDLQKKLLKEKSFDLPVEGLKSVFKRLEEEGQLKDGLNADTAASLYLSLLSGTLVRRVMYASDEDYSKAVELQPDFVLKQFLKP